MGELSASEGIIPRGPRIRALREAAGLTRRQVSGRLGFKDRFRLAGYEIGSQVFSARMEARIVAAIQELSQAGS